MVDTYVQHLVVPEFQRGGGRRKNPGTSSFSAFPSIRVCLEASLASVRFDENLEDPERIFKILEGNPEDFHEFS